MVKSTYVLDVETAETLDRLARDWQVSKSEALRRLIKSAGTTTGPDRVEAFRRLQRAITLTGKDADAWAKAARSERRAVDVRADRRRR